MSKIKVLEVVHGLAPGGIESFVISISENIDKNNYQIDYALACEGKQFHEERVMKNGNIIYRTSDLGGMRNKLLHAYRLYKLIKKEKYDVVHTHIDYFNGINCLVAKLAGVKNIVCHSHNTKSANAKSSRVSFSIELYHLIMRLFIFLFSNYKIGCSDLACEWMYGKKWRSLKNCYVVKNSIDTQNNFNPDNYNRDECRSNLGLKDSNINILTVGRICEQKNSLFIVEIINEMSKINPNIHFGWVSTGPQEKQVKDKIKSYEIEHIFEFYGVRKDIPQIMTAYDAFLFPSLWEGLPIVLIEYQTLGKVAFISDKITSMANIGKCIEISLEKSTKEWAINILDNIYSELSINKCLLEEHTIEHLIKQIQDIYENI